MRLTDYTYANYDYYAVHKECIKCGYTKITWKRYMIIQEIKCISLPQMSTILKYSNKRLDKSYVVQYGKG